MIGSNFEAVFAKTVDDFIEQRKTEQDLCEFMALHGLTPGQISEELEKAKNWQMLAAYIYHSHGPDKRAQQAIEGT